MSLSIAGRSSIGNYLSFSSLGGIEASQMMEASWYSKFLGGVLLGSMNRCSHFLRPVRACQWKYTGGFPAVGRTVSKKSSYLRWAWGDTIVICKLSIWDTDPACLGEGPKLMPVWALGSHLITPPLPPDSLVNRSNTWHPNEWYYLNLGATEVLDNLYNGHEASSLSVRQFLR